MKRVSPGLVVVLALMVCVGTAHAIPLRAAISGVVRDVHGTPQMGAVVELLTADATTVASALTDDHGRYMIAAVLPGNYELRASAAFFVPIIKNNLMLAAGAQAVLNLTMNTFFEAGNWLPTERRSSDEPADDWKWTLRSTANRPLLRLIDPDSGEEISSSASEAHRASTQARVTVVNGDGAFGDGGMHQLLTMDRVIEDGIGTIFRADLGDPQSPLTVAPSVDVMTGYQRTMPFGGRVRMVASYASHPELMANGVPGFEVLRMASAQQIRLGDAVMIDAGTLLEAERLEATRILSEPYVRLVFKPGSDVAVEYRYATGRELQSAEDLDRLKPQTTALSDLNGHPLSDKGSHHEFSVSRRLGNDAVSVHLYRDTFANGTVEGSGAIDGATMQTAQVVSDPTTATFRLAVAGYAARGAAVSYTHSLTPSLQATGEYAIGTALRGDQPGGPIGQMSMHGHNTSAASFTLHGRILRTGTSVNAEYHWQPVSTLTQVDAYNASPAEAYLSMALRQRIWGGRFLPKGMDAVVEATNLLEQGYTPVLAPDGHTLFLAQVPRAIQAGISFNF